MNTDAQRARNARKRAKQRAKRRGQSDNLLTWEITAEGSTVMITDEMLLLFRKRTGLLGKAAWLYYNELFDTSVYTGKVLMTSHDVSSSSLSSLETLWNTIRNSDRDTWGIFLQVNFQGRTRRHSWLVTTDEVEALAAEVVAALARF